MFESLKKIVLEKKQVVKKEDTLIARVLEEGKVVQVLGKQNKNNCIVVGANGVGKSSLLNSLKNKISSKILVIDDIELMDPQRSMELKQKIINKEVQCLISTSIKAYRAYRDDDGFFYKNFTPIFLAEPCNDDLLKIIAIKAKELEIFHNLFINPVVFQKLIDLTNRYILDSFMPASLVDCLDDICVKKRFKYNNFPQELEFLSKNIEELNVSEIDLAQEIELKAFKAKYDKLFLEWQSNKNKKHAINLYDVYEYFADKTGLDLSKIKESMEDKLNDLEQNLNSRVLGQEIAVREVVEAIKGKKNKNKPLCLCFSGPRGVGKYKVAKEIAYLLYDDYDNLVSVPDFDYKVVLTDDVGLANNKNFKNSIIIYKERNDFVEKVIEFRALRKKDARAIAKKQIIEIEKSLSHKNILFEVEEQAYMFLVSKGFSEELGVENMRDVINKELVLRLKKILDAKNLSACKIYIYYEHDGLGLRVK